MNINENDITSGKNILLVEDQVLIAMAQSMELKNHGYRVIHALNGEKAIETVKKNPLSFDLILMDVDLGDGMDGTQAAREILRENNIPVVFLSSHTEKNIVEKTEKITSYGYVVKDSGITVLDASIKMAFRLFETRQKLEDRSREVLEAGKLNQQVIDSAGEGIIVYGPDLRYRVWNLFMENITGISASEILGRHPLDIFPFLEETGVIGRLNRALAGGEPETIETRFIINQEGDFIWSVDSSKPLRNPEGDITGVIRIIQDISNRKKIEEQNEFERKNQEALINSTDDLIWSINRDFRLITGNDAFIRLYREYTGIRLQPGEKIVLENHFPESFVSYWKTLYKKTFAGECVHSEIYIPETDKIQHYWRENQLNPIYDGEEVIAAACFAKDITEKKRQEKMYILEKEALALYSIKKVSIEETLTFLLNGIREIHPAMYCSVLRLKNNKLYNWSSPHLPEGFNQEIEGISIGIGAGVCGTAAFLKKKVAVKNIATDPVVAGYRDLAEKYGLKSCWSHPIIDPEGNVLATFAIYLKKARTLSRPEELSVERVQIILKNIIENSRAEDKLNKCLLNFVRITEVLNGIVWYALPDPLRYTFVSKKAEKLLGYTTEQWLAEPGFWAGHIYPEDREPALNHYARAAENLEEQDFEYRMIAADGRIIWFRDIAEVITENDQVKELVGVMIDITEQKK
jgi:PAS domain S-box-containing protein